MKIKYYFQTPGKEISALLISVTWDGQRIQNAVGISTPTMNFNPKEQKFKKNSAQSAQLNNFLSKTSQEISDYYFNLVALKQKVSKEEMKIAIKEILFKKLDDESESKEKPALTISNIVDSFMDFVIESPVHKALTRKKYKTFHKSFSDFIAYNKDIEYSQIDYNYVQKFALYLSNVRNLSDPSIHKELKMLIVTINKAIDDGKIDSLIHKKIFKKIFNDFKLKLDSKKFALSKEDITKIENYIPSEPHIQVTKDIFLFEIYTTIRWGDLYQVSNATIDINERTLTFRQEKTSEMVTIPLIPKALNIITKYPNLKFPAITNQHYNRNIKDLAKLAGLDDLIQIERKSLNKTEKIIKYKWELIASHHARVTGIVNMAQSGALAEEIITVTGHSNPLSIAPYMQIAKNEKRKRSRIALEKAFE